MATFYDEIGKDAKGVLSGFKYGNSIGVSNIKAPADLAFAVNGKAGAPDSADVKLSYKVGDGINADVTVASSGKINGNLKLDKLADGLKATISSSQDFANTGKVALEYKQDKIGLKLDASTAQNLNATACMNASNASFGGSVAFNAAKSALTNYGIGCQYKADDYTAAATLADSFDTLTASCAYKVNGSTTLCGQAVHRLSGNDDTTFTLGGKLSLDGGAVAKGSLNNHGIVELGYSQDLKKGTSLAFSAQIDTKKVDAGAKLGLQLNIK